MEVVNRKVGSEKVEKLENKDRKEMQKQNFTSLEKENSREDFNKYFLNSENFNKLCETCNSGDMTTFRCRWTAWRVFLGLVPVGDETKMRDAVKKQRKFYAGEYEKYMNFRSKVQLSAEVDNPLSTSSSNPWNSFYGDSDLKDEIKKDIERTYQDLDFFLAPSTQQLLTNILFIWSKQNPEPSYRQGMNELAAVLTYACFIENYKANNSDTDIYDFLNDEKYAEADIYTMLKKLFELDQKSMFVYQPPTSKNGKPKKKPDSDGVSRPDLPVVHRAAFIQETLLPKVHPNLFNHLKSLQVEPHIYLMRWLRCMLVREFKIQQALVVWDTVFAYHYLHTPTSKKFEMLDYLCVAMIMSLSEEIFDMDNGGMCLGKLLKFPPTENVFTIIKNCQKEVLGRINSGGVQQNEQSSPENKGLYTYSNNKEAEKPKTSITSGAKKVVLFSPNNPILKTESPKEERNDPLEKKAPKTSNSNSPTQPISQSKPFSNPFGESVKKPETIKTELLKTEPIKTEKKPEEPKKENKLQTKLFEEEKPVSKPFTINDSSKKVITFSEPKKVEKKDKELDSSDGPLILFGQSKPNEKRENPFISKSNETKTIPVQEKKTVSLKDAGNVNDILAPTTQRETQDQIKKLQNAIKLVKLEGQSLGLKEALEDMNDVLKFLKEKMLKN